MIIFICPITFEPLKMGGTVYKNGCTEAYRAGIMILKLIVSVSKYIWA